MVPKNFPADFYRTLYSGALEVKDQGDNGVIVPGAKGLALCIVDTAGAEGRTLDSAANYPVLLELTVLLRNAVGALTITGAASGTEVLSASGDFAKFVVSDNEGTNEWRFTGSGQTDALEDAVDALELATTGLAIPEDTSSFTPIPATPDADDVTAALIALSVHLVSAGIITDPITQGT